ncbi:Putative protein of unknown function [Podospora comata]|uniref:Heterokaryon incompatibility domain-containing protein n=1 Tax=Podospora comata TaxID=48703 RepID=A0ABY6S9I9_PODCO|nr:Putative protein of unknown function [Podospora comata]
MSTRCPLCTELSIQHLFELTKQEVDFHDFPSSAYYKHHKSFNDLEQSAINGCDLCQLIIHAFKQNPVEEDQYFGLSSQDETMSMYEKAKSLEQSDVKIALTSTYPYRDNSSPLTIVDTLAVQVGGFMNVDYGDDDVIQLHYEIPVMPLRLVVPPDQPTTLKNVRIGISELDSDLGSQENFEIARSWLQECQQCHRCCQDNKVPTLPTRVVDVGTPDNDFKTLRVVHSHGSQAPFVALSHCWGGRIEPVLTTKTLDTFTTSLSFDSLPANFRDAITITRKLGIQYLWIDSLCIMQDSRQDWEVESKKMAQIYGSSTFTISAFVSKRSTAGILNPAPTAGPPPMSVPLTMLSEQGEARKLKLEWRHPSDREDLRRLDMACVLNSRGWTFQEFLLSRRHLIYGRHQIYWRCRAGQKSAEAGILPEGDKRAHSVFDDITAVLDASNASDLSAKSLRRKDLFREYYSLVGEYSNRTLTIGSDKLPALSGITQRLHASLGARYLAGLWSSDVRNGLLWKEETQIARHVQPYRAPSWSWAVTDDTIQWDGYTTDYGQGPHDLELVEASVEPKNPSNPFGEIMDARLVLRGRTKKLYRSEQVFAKSYFPGPNHEPSIGDGSWDEPVDGCPRRKRLDVTTALLYIHDVDDVDDDAIVSVWRQYDWVEATIEETEIQPACFDQNNEYLALLVRISSKENPFKKDGTVAYKQDDARLMCLALRRVVGREDKVYERVGMLWVRADQWDVGWIEKWELQTTTLV